MLAAVMSIVTLAAAAESSVNCGTASLVDICALSGRDLSSPEIERVSQAMAGSECSMLQIAQVAKSVGIGLEGVRASLEQVVKGSGAGIVHLSKPEHFMVLARSSGEWVQLLDGGQIVVVPRAEIEKRYSGHALILKQEPRTGGPRLELAEFH